MIAPRPRLSILILLGALGPMLALFSCTGQLPNSFRLAQQEEIFQSSEKVNTKLDMLWVVDNSPSMGSSQKKIREGFASFAAKYMQPTWDIRVAVISQDTYLAHPSFRNYLNAVGDSRYTRASGYQSTYLNPSSTANPRRSTPFVSPSWWGSTRIDSTGTLVGGLKLRQGVPDYGGVDPTKDVSATNPSAWARLIPGRHDGPLQTICWTSYSNPFFYGVTQCHVRDHQDLYSGVDGCVSGGTGASDSSVQCVNTIMNNTVRSGRPIISTQPPFGVAADAAWTQQLYRDFLVNLSGGVSGLGVEKFLNSIQQLLADNEAPGSATPFFRTDALRVIIFVTDEDDQSMVLPSTQITPQGYGYSSGSVCPWKTVDGHTYRLDICPDEAKLLPVATFKAQLDEFFRALDGHPGTGDPNWLVVTITPKTGAAIQSIHDELGENAAGYAEASADLATRLFELADSVGNGSLKLELTSSDYSPLLDAIGLSVVQKKATFQLRRAPTAQEDMVVKIVHADGTSTLVPPSDYSIQGKNIVFRDLELVRNLQSTDQIVINYQPKTVN